MKRLIVLLLFASGSLLAQDLKPTTSFSITGKVKSPVTIGLKDFSKWKTVDIGDVTITNHLGEKKSESKGLKGVLLRDVLKTIEIDAESPKVLSEYYFVCKANDNYTVVYSWNEIFNTAVGESSYLVTEKNGKSLEAMPDAILMISTKDQATGRRQVKSLTTIEVKRAN